MQASEGLGLFGWVALGLIVLAVVVAVTTSYSNLFYFAILLTPVMLYILIDLCRGEGTET